jgi:tetrahydromethanopterin S-methyltransferase subunit A
MSHENRVSKAGEDEQWPPVAGDVVFGDAESPVAVCTLASHGMLPSLAGRSEIAIAGRVYTENVGIEKMVQNLVANPRLRVLIVCGRESRHRVGQAILSLHRKGVDADGRIVGALGPEPLVPNLQPEQIVAFQRRVRVVDMIGELDPERVLEAARQAAVAAAATTEETGPESVAPGSQGPTRTVATPDPVAEWRQDPHGFFIISVDRPRGLLVCEHYDANRRLANIVEGATAQAVSQTIVRLGLVSELAHAAYLGRELALAEVAMKLEREYRQDTPFGRGKG